MKDPLLTLLSKGLQALNLQLDHITQQRLIAFLHFLQKWNRAYNLTAIDSLPEMVTQHLLDSLAVVPYIHGQRILDVGTGAGFPGVPLALYYPEKHFVLLDSNGKKIRFLQQVRAEFHIPNIEPVQARMEKFTLHVGFDVIICRALGKIHDVMSATEHLLSPTGQWLFMKGVYPAMELDLVSQSYAVHKIGIPETTVERHIVIVDKKE